MNPTRTSRARRGLALLMALVAMAVITVVLSVITTQIITQRQMVRQRQRQFQAEWLARAGVELAAAKLLESPTAFVDPKQELVPDSKLRIVVEKAEGDAFKVTADAEVGLAEGRPVSRSATSHFRRTDKGGTIRLEAVTADKK